MGFRGFPPEGLQFYEELEADNSKAFWQENRPRYEKGDSYEDFDQVPRA
jgi:uncharacterized protein (DUF2461 family)